MKKLGIIISGFGGVGKTYLAQKYKNVCDLESGPYKYDYRHVHKKSFEKLKGESGRKRRGDWPENYINAINEAIKKYDIVCVRYNGDESVDFYDTYDLNYIVCYPTKSAYKNYLKRFKERGNSDEWIEKNKKYFDVTYNRCKKFNGKKILLHNNETLEDALIKRGYKLIPKD
ncbi:MAG: hypothetical protein J5689_02145 [Clostridia bacterium]|nr:hypothetical protein [Clostridia bacterium]